jgi:SET domain-containing protein
MRVGSCTRFINHSCRPNTEFIRKRVSKEIIVCVEVIRHISVGEELTIGHGSAYWEEMAKKGLYCGCGEMKCKFSGGKATGASI